MEGSLPKKREREREEPWKENGKRGKGSSVRCECEVCVAGVKCKGIFNAVPRGAVVS